MLGQGCMSQEVRFLLWMAVEKEMRHRRRLPSALPGAYLSRHSFGYNPLDHGNLVLASALAQHPETRVFHNGV
jgi:hypothetical protein